MDKIYTHSEGQEIPNSVPFGGRDGGQYFGLVHAQNDGSVGEAGDLARLESDQARANLEFLSGSLEDLRARDGRRRVCVELGLGG